MSERKWTPGPWVIGKDAEGGEGFGWFVGAGGYCRADIVGPTCDTKANAHLIAAAPELYEALDHLYHKAMLTHGDREIVREALAKARGEQ